ncbi:Uncharacterized protein conserved in bacteria [Leminorella richardii]|uniref:Uncharacterized protein conserved in bacteria n=1 Tax=Leminorella richardii TaxID=158841 RepID=A0A2X4V9B1_9GAMM|nr:DUF1993 domain-containing protein [Leminorella richardii]SQI43292.1 Uncharacterized protein conserved in bacteria [Leminorella richardii]
MSLSYYQLATQSTIRVLNNLDFLLSIASAFCKERRIEEQVLLNSRLAPDMFPLVRQIQLVSDMTKSCAARLAGLEPPIYEDSETTFAQLKARIANTISYIKTLEEKDFTDSESREIKLPWYDEPMRGDVFLLQHALPNIYFHITTAYNILRNNGVAVGKRDYLGKI